MWTEIIADALRNSGHTVDHCYHNHKTLTDRIALTGKTLRVGENRKNTWKQRHRQQLIKTMSHSRWDILLSIQGTVNRHTVNQLRQHSPHLRIIYWWGDILTGQAQLRIKEAADFSDRLMLSYLGSYKALKPVYQDKLAYYSLSEHTARHTRIGLGTWLAQMPGHQTSRRTVTGRQSQGLSLFKNLSEPTSRRHSQWLQYEILRNTCRGRLPDL